MLDGLKTRLRALFFKRQAESDLDEELSYHIEKATQQNIARGLPASEARQKAIAIFGGIEQQKEASRDVKGVRFIDDMLRDLRYGFRRLVSSPAFTGAALLTLALGIGANTAVFSVVNAVMLRSLPFKQPDRLVVLESENPLKNLKGEISYADYLDYRVRTDIFEKIAIFTVLPVDIVVAGEPQRVQLGFVSEDYFTTLGCPIVAGRDFLPNEFAFKGGNPVMISDRLWKSRFHGDPSAINRQVSITGLQGSIVGVVQSGSSWPSDVDIWEPFGIDETSLKEYMRRDLQVWRSVARLAPGVNMQQADAFVASIAARAERDQPDVMRGWKKRVVPMNRYILGPEVPKILLAILAAAALVLLIACVNVANLVLGRAASREREFAIRLALGARRGQIIRQLLTESLLLAVGGGTLGLLTGIWGVKLLVRAAPKGIPRLSEVSLDWRVICFAAVVSLSTVVIFALIPSLHSSKPDVNVSLKEGGRGVTGGRRGRHIRGVLVVAEIALSLTLLIAAGLLVRSIMRLNRIDPGLRVEGLLTMDIAVPQVQYAATVETLIQFYVSVEHQVRNVPGVQSTALASNLPLGGGGFYVTRPFIAQGHPEPPVEPTHQAEWATISPGYFETMGIPLLLGRPFNQNDNSSSAKVVVISQALANEMFPNESPLGKRISVWRNDPTLREVVGVVKDVRYMGLTDRLRGVVYVPHPQSIGPTMCLVVRSSTDPAASLQSVTEAIHRVSSDVAIANVQTMQSILNDSVSIHRFSMDLFLVFASLALALAFVGVYGILSYWAAQRTNEIGVRMALGAEKGTVIKMLLTDGLKLAGVGIAVGLAVSFMATRPLAALLYQTSPTDVLTFVAVPSLLGAVAAFASYVPARRAASADPLRALRCD